LAGLVLALGRRAGWAQAVVRELTPKLSHYEWLRARIFESDHFALSLVQHRNVEPAVWDTDGTSQVVVFGEYLHECGDRVGDDVRAHVAAARWSALRNGNGLYNLIHWESRCRRLVLANDAIGALLLFRANYREGCVWSSEPGALPPAGALDVAGLRSLIAIGYQADGRTLDEEIKVMPPATTEVVRLTASGIRHERHTGLPDAADSEPHDAAFARLFHDAVTARLPASGQVYLPITGGLDSRLLLAETLAAGCVARTFTSAVGNPRDVRLAQRIAKIAGVEHRILPPQRPHLRRHGSLLRGALHTTSDWHVAQQLDICGAASPGNPLLLGFLGGTVTGAFVDSQGAEVGIARMRANALAPYPSVDDASLIAWYEAPDVSARPTVAELIENLYGRQRRYISYLVRLAWNFGRPICPFADVRLLQHALAARREWLAGQRVRGRTLRRINPSLAQVATTNDDMEVGPPLQRRLRNIIRHTRVMRPVKAIMPLRLSFDYYERLRPLADECAASLTGLSAQRILAGRSPMAVLALAPVLLEEEHHELTRSADLIESILGQR